VEELVNTNSELLDERIALEHADSCTGMKTLVVVVLDI
jgi:hypothetical protein